MKVICKDSSDLIEGPKKLLTIDKIYEVIKVGGWMELYFIEDNTGEKRWYDSKRFIDMDLVRNEKLKQIGI